MTTRTSVPMAPVSSGEQDSNSAERPQFNEIGAVPSLDRHNCHLSPLGMGSASVLNSRTVFSAGRAENPTARSGPQGSGETRKGPAHPPSPPPGHVVGTRPLEPMRHRLLPRFGLSGRMSGGRRMSAAPTRWSRTGLPPRLVVPPEGTTKPLVVGSFRLNFRGSSSTPQTTQLTQHSSAKVKGHTQKASASDVYSSLARGAGVWARKNARPTNQRESGALVNFRYHGRSERTT